MRDVHVQSIQHSVGRSLKVARAVDQSSIEVENDRNNLRQVVSGIYPALSARQTAP
ncbi:MAG: hypothetical protein WCA14_16630 [Steroidobacteraceae bacterium]